MEILQGSEARGRYNDETLGSVRGGRARAEKKKEKKVARQVVGKTSKQSALEKLHAWPSGHRDMTRMELASGGKVQGVSRRKLERS